MTATGHGTTQLEMSELIVAKYTAHSVFKVPKEYRKIPLMCFEVRRDTLYIYNEECPRKLLCEVKASFDAEDAIDWKRPDEIFFTQNEFPYSTEESDDEEDEEEKEEPTTESDTLLDELAEMSKGSLAW